MLLFWPCLWGLTIAYDFNSQLEKFYFYSLLFLLGSMLMRSAGCIVNDIVDKNFDKKVERTKNRPIASAMINLSEVSFDELRELLCLSTLPRPASLFLKTSKYLEGASGVATMRNSGLALEIYDLSWRFPVL